MHTGSHAITRWAAPSSRTGTHKHMCCHWQGRAPTSHGKHSLHTFLLLPKFFIIKAKVVNEGRGHALHLEVHEGLQEA